VMILGLTAWLENEWGPRRLVILCACISVGFAFAATDVFVGAAALGGLVVENGAAREWRRVVHVLLAGVATGGACAIIYLLAVKPNVIPSLKSYWNADYLYRNQGYGHIARIVYDRIEGLDRYMGFGHPVALGVPTAIGLAGLIVDRRYALALTLPGTVAINIVAALAHAYPFGDERTSTYWLIMPPVIMAVGVAYLAYWAARWSRLIPGGVLVCALLPWVWATHPYVRSHLLPYEDARAEVTYFNTRYRAGDVLILDEEANYQFAFYEHRLTPSYSHLSSAAVGFVPVYPNQKWIIGLRDRQPTSVDYSLSAAVSYIDAEPAATRGRIWIIRSHMNPAEGGAWSADLAGRSVLAGPGGADPILLYTPAPSDPTTAAVQRASTSPQRQ